MKQRSIACILFLLMTAVAAQAEDFSALVDAAKQSFPQDKVKAVQEARQAILSVWNDLPLTADNARLVEDTKEYAPRESNVYASGEKIFMTAELIGAQIKKIGHVYSIEVATDFYLRDEKAEKILFEKKNFGRFAHTSPVQNTEFFLNLSYTLTGMPAGIYTLQTVVRDVHSGKSTMFSNAVEIKL